MRSTYFGSLRSGHYRDLRIHTLYDIKVKIAHFSRCNRGTSCINTNRWSFAASPISLNQPTAGTPYSCRYSHHRGNCIVLISSVEDMDTRAAVVHVCFRFPHSHPIVFTSVGSIDMLIQHSVHVVIIVLIAVSSRIAAVVQMCTRPLF